MLEPITPLNTIKITTALLGGFLSFFSPCVLPLIPSFMGVLLTGDMKRRGEILARILGFFIGLSTLFALMGAFSGLFGMMLTRYRTILRYSSGVILLMLAFFFFFDLRIIKGSGSRILKYAKKGFFPAFLFGGVVGSVWIPCASPVLGAILVLAANTGTMLHGAILLFTYSLGISIPFLVLGGTIGSTILKKLSFGPPRWEKLLKYAGAFFLGFMGILLIVGKL